MVYFKAVFMPTCIIGTPSGHTDILQILLERGADRDAQDVNGNTPLHLAVSSNRIQCVQLLLNGGADPFLPDRFLRTPLQLVQGYVCLQSPDDDGRVFDLAKHFWRTCSRLRILTDPDFCNQAPDNLLAEVKQVFSF